MNRRLIILSLVLVMSLGCLEDNDKSISITTTSNTIVSSTSTTLIASVGLNLSEVKEIIDLNESFQCRYDTQGIESYFWYHNGKHLTRATIYGLNSYILFDGETGYFWNNMVKEGERFDVTENEQNKLSGNRYLNVEFIYNEGSNIYCEKTNLENASFSPPADKNFKILDKIV